MAHIFKRVATKPIIVVRVYDKTSFHECELIWQQVDRELTASHEAMLYWIIDMTDMMMSQSDFIRMVEASYCHRPGTVSDPRIVPITVATIAMVKALRDMIINRGGLAHGEVNIPVFPRVYDAYLFVEMLRLAA